MDEISNSVMEPKAVAPRYNKGTRILVKDLPLKDNER